jgi:hypothetical protein
VRYLFYFGYYKVLTENIKYLLRLQEFEQQQQQDILSTFIKEEKIPIDLSKPAKSKSLPTVRLKAH